MATVGVVGATTWGTTLSILAAQQGLDARLWARTENEASQLRTDGRNKRFLPDAPFPAGMSVASSTTEAFGEADLVIVAVPARTLRDNVRAVRDSLNSSSVIVSATKGLELGTGRRMSQVLEEELPEGLSGRVCALSGPNLAGEIILGKVSSTVVASGNEEAARSVQSHLSSARFRVYTHRDIVGVEFGGALKNIIALGAGICDGLQVGDNAKAAFITRGLAEISRLAVAAGAERLTLSGLAGMGDLIATCANPLSRNHRVGVELAQGRSLDEIRAGMTNVAEGIDTTAAAVSMAKKLNVELPITRATYDVLFNGLSIEQAIAELMDRTPRPEYAESR